MQCIKKICHGSKGFSIIELLVVIAILGTLAAIAGVSFGKYIGTGKTEAYNTELQDIQTAVVAMISESSTGQLDSAQTDIADMNLVTADSGTRVLSGYLKMLDGDSKILTGCTYSFTVDGRVTQKTP